MQIKQRVHEGELQRLVWLLLVAARVHGGAVAEPFKVINRRGAERRETEQLQKPLTELPALKLVIANSF